MCPKISAIAAMANPDAMAVAKTDSPLPETDDDAAAPDTTRVNRKVAKHSTATAFHSSRLRASFDIDARRRLFISALCSCSACNFSNRVTRCVSTSRGNVSCTFILGA